LSHVRSFAILCQTKFGFIQKFDLHCLRVVTDSAALLRQRGIHVTAQRLAVLRAVAGQPHITADAVAEVVRTGIGAISLQSVYDTLALLVSEGLIRRIQLSGSSARFEDRVGDNHHHLICRTCGRVVDVDCAVGAARCLTPKDDRGYEIDEAEVAYWGRCPDCVEQSSPAPPGEGPSRARTGQRRAPRTRPPTKPPTDGKSIQRHHNRPTRRSRRG
jgi:Fe2+ or Zn2+ uptake regulation protein